MKTKNLANLYAQLSAEERFRLIVAASDRGDETERERLESVSERITFFNLDYSPYAQALQEFATLEFLVLVEEVVKFDYALERWSDADMMHCVDGQTDTPAPPENDARTIKDQLFQMFLAEGFLLRMRVAGWTLFCSRMGVSPFGLWQYLPGFERLQRKLNMVEETTDRPWRAFTPADMTRSRNRIRPMAHPR
jgi:hypothetical protein